MKIFCLRRRLFQKKMKIILEKGDALEAQDKDIIMVGLGLVGLYDQWVAHPVSGPRRKARYEHGAVVIDDKMYIYGGNHNGRYLNDLQDQRTEASQTSGPHQKPLKLSVRPPLIPNEDEQEKKKVLSYLSESLFLVLELQLLKYLAEYFLGLGRHIQTISFQTSKNIGKSTSIQILGQYMTFL